MNKETVLKIANEVEKDLKKEYKGPNEKLMDELQKKITLSDDKFELVQRVDRSKHNKQVTFVYKPKDENDGTSAFLVYIFVQNKSDKWDVVKNPFLFNGNDVELMFC